MEENISELEDLAIEPVQSGAHRGKRITNTARVSVC